MSFYLCELDEIMLEINRISMLRRFMRHRLRDISYQLDYAADWIAYCLKEEKCIPSLHLQMALQKAIDDLMIVIHYKTFMRRELLDLVEKIYSVKVAVPFLGIYVI